MASDSLSVGRLAPPDAARITRGTAMLSVAVAGLLILAKLWAWVATDSVSILASLADSGLDFAASVFTLGAVSYAAAPPDATHRYGHGKAESFAGLFQAMLVGVSAALIGIEAVDHLYNPRVIAGGTIGVAVMLLSIVLTLALIRMQTRAVRKTGSVATAGDRAHYAADLGANVAVIAGVGASAFLDIPMADPVIGLGVAVWLGWGAFGVVREAASQLMDHELSSESRERIKALARGDDARLEVHQLRTRASGPIIHIQYHLDLPNTISLVEAHRIMVASEERILSEFPAADILIHPDPKGAEPHGGDFFGETGAYYPASADAADNDESDSGA